MFFLKKSSNNHECTQKKSFMIEWGLISNSDWRNSKEHDRNKEEKL